MDLSAEERAALEADARAAAREDFPGLPYSVRMFHDGLGALGVGSWEDGKASVKNAAYRDEIQRLKKAPA